MHLDSWALSRVYPCPQRRKFTLDRKSSLPFSPGAGCTQALRQHAFSGFIGRYLGVSGAHVDTCVRYLEERSQSMGCLHTRLQLVAKSLKRQVSPGDDDQSMPAQHSTARCTATASPPPLNPRIPVLNPRSPFFPQHHLQTFTSRCCYAGTTVVVFEACRFFMNMTPPTTISTPKRPPMTPPTIAPVLSSEPDLTS